MKGGGRYSAVAVSTIRPEAQVIERLRPPYGLNDEECEVWRSCVDAHPADWFAAGGSVFMLAQFCRHTIMAKRVAELIEQSIDQAAVDELDLLLRMQDRESKSIAMLSTKLRMTPASTSTYHGNKKPGLSRKKVPWEEKEEVE